MSKKLNTIKEILNQYNAVVEYAGNSCNAGDIIDRIEEELGDIQDRVNLEDEIKIIMQDFVIDNMNDDNSEYEDWYTNKIADVVAEYYNYDQKTRKTIKQYVQRRKSKTNYCINRKISKKTWILSNNSRDSR